MSSEEGEIQITTERQTTASEDTQVLGNKSVIHVDVSD